MADHDDEKKDKRHGTVDYDHLLHTQKFLKWFWNNPENAVHLINTYKGKSRKGKWPRKPFLRLEVFRPTFYCVMLRDISFIAARGSEVLQWRICKLWFSDQGHTDHEEENGLEKVHDGLGGWFSGIKVHQFVHILRYLLNHLKDGVDEIKVLSKYADRVQSLKTELKELKERVLLDDSKESEKRLLERILQLRWTYEEEDNNHSESESESEDDDDEEEEHKPQRKSSIGTKPHSPPRKSAHAPAHHTSPHKGHDHHTTHHAKGSGHHPVHHKGHAHPHKGANGDHGDHNKHGHDKREDHKKSEHDIVVKASDTHGSKHTETDNHAKSHSHEKSAKRKLRNLVFDLPVQDTEISIHENIEKDICHKVGDPLPEGLVREMEFPVSGTDFIVTTQNFIHRVKEEMKAVKSHASTRILQDGNVIFRRDLYFKHPSIMKTAQVKQRK